MGISKNRNKVVWLLCLLILYCWGTQKLVSHIPSDSASHLPKALHDVTSAILDNFGGTEKKTLVIMLPLHGQFFSVAFLCHSLVCLQFSS